MIEHVVAHAGNLTNTSSSITSGFGSVTTLIGPVLWVAAIAVLLLAVRSSRWFDHLASVGEWFARSLFYAIHGAAAATTLALLAAPPYLFATADANTRGAVVFWAAVAVVAYAGLVAVGYITRHGFVEPTVTNLRERGVFGDSEDGGSP